MRLEAPAYNADEGAKAANGDFGVPVSAQGGLLVTSRPDNCYFAATFTRCGSGCATSGMAG